MKKILFLTTIILTYIMFSSNILAASMSVSASSNIVNVQDRRDFIDKDTDNN